MAGGGPDDGSTYSPRIAFMYVFNLIVGTGALALPSVLTLGGWVLGTLFLALVAVSSYIAVTFMIESMASANAILAMSKPEQVELLGSDAGEGTEDEAETLIATSTTTATKAAGVTARETCPSPLKNDAAASATSPAASATSLHLGASNASNIPAGSPVLALQARSQASLFEIVQRTELGQMAELFFSETGRIFFYIALICYLFGDATIYCTFIPRSLVGFVYGKAAPSWAFDAFLAAFVAVIVPFCFFDFQKTKHLQMFTLVIRNVALFTMILLSAWLVSTQGSRTKGVPNFNVKALPNLFGGAVYAFMCHHSLPGIITPMRNKAWVSFVLKSAFLSVFTIYFMLFLSCGFAFGLSAEDPITFNFLPSKFGLIGDFLFLFPVFTLSSNYPMLTITLRNNLDTLLHLLLPRGGGALLPPVAAFSPRPLRRGNNADFNSLTSLGGPQQLRNASRSRRLIVTCIAVGPPILCCLLAEHIGVDVSSLVGLTGAYAGAAVMLIIPACLVHCSRVVVNEEISGPSSSAKNTTVVFGLRLGPNWLPHPANHHASPFRNPLWVISLILLAILAIVFITFNQVFEAGFH